MILDFPHPVPSVLTVRVLQVSETRLQGVIADLRLTFWGDGANALFEYCAQTPEFFGNLPEFAALPSALFRQAPANRWVPDSIVGKNILCALSPLSASWVASQARRLRRDPQDVAAAVIHCRARDFLCLVRAEKAGSL